MKQQSEINKLKLHRLNFFTDAVLAIILTLLVLELHLPHLSNEDSASEMLMKLKEMLPQFGSLVLCFLVTANAFLDLSTFYSSVEKYDDKLAVCLVMLLLPLSLMPFASVLIGQFFLIPCRMFFSG